MFQEKSGIYYVYGRMYVGDSTQSAATSMIDDSRVMRFGDSEYYTGSVWVTSIPDGNNGITVEDAASYITTFQDGVIVGSDAGRSGSTFIGSEVTDTTFDLYGGSAATSLTKLYGSSLQGIDGGINFGNDGDHHVYSVSFSECGQVDPVGAPVIRNALFINTASTAGSLLWNESIDIEDSSFISNTTGAAVEHPSNVGSPYSHTDLTYSGNTYDVNNTSGSAITVNKSGTSNPSTYTGSTVTFIGSVPVTFEAVDRGDAAIENCQISAYLVSDDSEVILDDTNASGIASTTFSGSTPADMYYKYRKSSTGAQKYVFLSGLGTIKSSTGSSIKRSMKEDNIADPDI
jgi:hypothetical protein